MDSIEKCCVCLSCISSQSYLTENETNLYEKLVENKLFNEAHICDSCKNQLKLISEFIDQCQKNLEFLINEKRELDNILKAEIIFDDQPISENEYSFDKIEILNAGNDKIVQKTAKTFDCNQCHKPFASKTKLNIHLSKLV
jgi:hypothetical protein